MHFSFADNSFGYSFSDAVDPVSSKAAGDNADEDAKPKETVTFKVVFNKKKYDVTFALEDTVADLKTHLETLTGNMELFIH